MIDALVHLFWVMTGIVSVWIAFVAVISLKFLFKEKRMWRDD